MYKLSYEKCVCFIFLVILVFLSCSGFHTDRLVTLTGHDKKYPFTAPYYSLHENAQVDGAAAARGGLLDRIVRLAREPPPPAGAEHRRRARRHARATHSISTVEHQTDHERHLEATRQRRATAPTQNNTQRRNKGGGGGAGGKKERRFCPGLDVGTRTYHAKTIIEGRVRSSTSTTNRKKKYAITLEVKKVHKDKSDFRPLNKNETIRLHFAVGRARGCDSRLIDGLVRAQLTNGKDYIFFLDRIGTHNYTVLGQPVPLDAAKLRDIQNVLANKVSGARVSPLQSTSVRSHEKLRLVCKTRASPPPVVHWYKDGRELQAGKPRRLRIKYMEKKSVLVITKVRPEDAGTYECRAKSVVGPVANTSAVVTVHRETPTTTTTPTDPEGSRRAAPTDSEGSRFTCIPPAREEICLNGGTCIFYQALGEYACRCADGFNGQRCEKKDVTSKSSMYRHSSYCRLGQSNTYYC